MQIKELGHVVLYVSDLTLVADFYRDTLGFHEIERKSGMAIFSSGRTHHELLLIEIGLPRRSDSEAGGAPKSKHVPEIGLYHIGFKVGDSSEDIQNVYQELLAKGVTITGSADHHVTHSLYIIDPDGNELELYADVSEEWKTNPKAVLAPVKPLHLEIVNKL
ncbi:MAG: VOC family protein [Candidatus Moraniibacteriota bacterium]